MDGSTPEARSRKPFKVFNCYLNKEPLEEVHSAFNTSLRWDGKSIHHVLQLVKELIKNRALGFKNQLDLKIAALENLMVKLESDGTDMGKYQQVNCHLKEMYKKKDSMLRQKSRMEWIALKDGNTGFFHQAIQRRIFKSSINKILFEGRWISDSAQIREIFFMYYCQFFRNNHAET